MAETIGGMKVCKHCGIEKSVLEFNKAGGGKWLQPYCKPCDSERKKRYRAQNIEKIKAAQKQHYYNNREVILANQKASRDAKPKKQRVFIRMPEEERKRRKSLCDKRYRERNRDRIMGNKRKYRESGRANEIGKRWQERQSDNIEFKTKKRLRGRIYVALKRGIKSESTMRLLGCSIDFFKCYFESLFTHGMSWDKYIAGDIVIDHIKPCVLFDLTDPEQQKICFNYKNLQPLWKIDNLKKGTTYGGN